MMPVRGFWAYWSLTVPNMILAVLIYLLIARGLLSLVLGDSNILMRALHAITRPAVGPVGALTPRLVPQIGVCLFAIAVLYVLRIALYVVTPVGV